MVEVSRTGLYTGLNKVVGFKWTAGWTNTSGLLTDAINEFEDYGSSERAKVLIIITDGNPCLPPMDVNCPHSVCNRSAEIKNEGKFIYI